eukprot:TRINITY_DN3520_c0_g1_i2.p1 TRINITY_DN3520_c0_g1~~TRINITY_DN3520_c0_g1_i2.p1  ORF type:complete len:122 (-),score=16.30 TRINITY_DN3520_c0_g1_i2:51-416(-)
MNSVTDKRMIEDDIFRNIISEAARNFIDVGMLETPPLHEQSYLKRKNKYKKHVEDFPIMMKSSLAFFTLPPTTDGNSNVSSLNRPIPQCTSLSAHAQTIETEISRIQVLDVGPIIMPFSFT